MKSTYLDDCHVDYILKSKKALILLDGLPVSKSRSRLMIHLSKMGYSVFYPSYLGTKLSKGKFLENSPTIEIDLLITRLSENFQRKKFQEINILSSSFGAAVAACIKKQELIKKVVLLSPVINFKKINNIEALEAHLITNHKDDYRFESKKWKLLINNKVLNPEIALTNTKYRSKFKVYIGDSDDQINPKYVLNFTRKLGIKFELLKNTGHISFSKINSTTLNQLVPWFES